MSDPTQPPRKRPFGAEVTDEGVHFRVWAPERHSVEVVLLERGASSRRQPLSPDGEGHFTAHIHGIGPGQRYFFRVDDDPRDYPDPASCFQPEGVHGPSQVVDGSDFAWTDGDWPGVSLPGQVLYEMHVGTWTPEGTWEAAAARLPHLADVGVTLVEVMPVAEFHGRFGWGYDGVYWYAPTRLYGEPDDFRRFVDRAHQLRLGVILDVVYNHFGPTGNYTAAFSPYYLSNRHPTAWGDGINYDGEQSENVCRFVAGNAAYWIREFHLDGLRLDAIQAIADDSDDHILARLARESRAAAENRSILIFAEDEHQQARNVQSPDEGGFGLDGSWNDDFHHACRVAATGHSEFYYGDYIGSPQELISAARYGYLYQGQWHQRQNRYRGSPTLGIPAARFVNALLNHDQVSNSAQGLPAHLLTSPGRWRALTSLLLLGPGTPLLFMGQEFGASSPFPFFADHEADIAESAREGRWSFLRCFPRVAGAAGEAALPDPGAVETFEMSKLDWSERDRNDHVVQLHRDLIKLRKSDAVFSQQDASNLHGAVIGPEALVLRWVGPSDDDRVLLLNLGRDLHWQPASQPLLAPPAGRTWRLLWSSEAPKYGGAGTAELNPQRIFIPGHAAIVLTSEA